MNLRIEPSTIKEDMQFPWISDSGIANNIQQIINEFIEEHKLKPLRLCILGPPCIGKTTLAKELCKMYRLHHIHLKGLLYEYIRNLLEPIKAYEHLLLIREQEQNLTSEKLFNTTNQEINASSTSVNDSNKLLFQSMNKILNFNGDEHE
ncbi:unnamed protein product, partial [Schistosoma turkestanicum]